LPTSLHPIPISTDVEGCLIAHGTNEVVAQTLRIVEMFDP